MHHHLFQSCYDFFSPGNFAQPHIAKKKRMQRGRWILGAVLRPANSSQKLNYFQFFDFSNHLNTGQPKSGFICLPDFLVFIFWTMFRCVNDVKYPQIHKFVKLCGIFYKSTQTNHSNTRQNSRVFRCHSNSGPLCYGKDLRVLISTFSNLDRITVSKISLYNTDLFLKLHGFIY